VLLVADAEGDLVLQSVVVGMLLVTLLITLICLLLAAKVQQVFGVTGMHVVTRIFGVLLSALAVQFVFDGIAQSGLLGS
jgi:multiple antibiotic resistance protein